MLLADSFEQGEWNGNWVEDSQNDWFRSTHRASDGSYAAEVDGRATNAALTLASPIDLTVHGSADLTFSWFIESNWDGGEYLAVDGYDGTNWNELSSLRGNVDQENVWHNESITIDGSYLVDDFKIRFRANVSSSKEDGHVDNVKIESTSAGLPQLSINDATATEGGTTWGFADAIALDGDGLTGWGWGIAEGSDGKLYAGFSEVITNSASQSRIARIDAATGDVDHDFISLGSAGLFNAKEIEVHGGWVYVSNKGTNEVLRFNETTGVPDSAGAFVSDLSTPRGMAFDSAGNLLVSNKGADEILKFDSSGASLGVFASAVTAGTGPKVIAVDTTGNVLYVAGNDRIYKYSTVTGSSLGQIVSVELTDPAGVELGPDGDLYVTNVATDRIHQFDTQTDALVAIIPHIGYGEPQGIAFDDAGTMYVAGNLDSGDVVRLARNSSAVFTVNLSSPSAVPVTIDFATTNASAAAGSDYAAASGTLVFDPGVTSRAIIISTLDDSDVEGDETFNLTLTAPVGATITDGLGQGTIVSDDVPPPSISINDATATEGDVVSSQFADAFVTAGSGELDGPGDLVFGADGNLYVGSKYGDAVLRYNGATGEFIDTFVSPGSGGLDNPQGLLFGPDGHLYVTSRITDEVLRFDSSTGAFIDAFVTAGSGGLDDPTEFAFGPDGHLYVSSDDTNQVLRYDGTTGAFINEFVLAGAGGIDRPHGLVFGPDANLYVISQVTDSVLRYDGTTGAFIDTFVASGSGGLDGLVHLTFGPNGDLFVGSSQIHSVLRYDGTSGAFIEAYVSSGNGGLASPIGLLFDSNDVLYVSSRDTHDVLRYGTASQAVFTVTLSSPSVDPVTVDFATSNGTATAGSDYTAAGGTLFFAPGVTSRAIIVSTLDDLDVEGDETLTLSLNAPIGATISDGTVLGTIVDNEVANVPPTANAGADQTVDDADNNGSELVTLNGSGSDTDGTITGYQWKEGTTVLGTTASISPTLGIGAHTLTLTVTDNDGATASDTVIVTVNPVVVNSTKFYVVDNSVDDMFEYQADGSFVENYNLGAGNNSPKGVAADVTGSTVWVIDNDDHVYVHANTGNLLREWKANGLSRPEGIATDGVDVWIVDRGNDRVHYFAGGATRTSDTGATSSFSLVSGNPRGITTDGTHLWVVDASTDDVYKYTVDGSFVGSWALDSRNTTPTGITINPGDVNDIWVIDSTDDDIYQYSAAASRLSGGQSADAVFALAGGNTNPQGIADPPPASAPVAEQSVIDIGWSQSQLAMARGSSRQFDQPTGQNNDSNSLTLAGASSSPHMDELADQWRSHVVESIAGAHDSLDEFFAESSGDLLSEELFDGLF